MEKKEKIKKWIELALTPVKNIQSNAPSSYGLKHYCEDAIGEYVHNNEIIECMNELGFKRKRHSLNSPNYDFNISKIINKVEFIDPKTTRCYDDSSRVFHKKSKNITVEL